MGSGSDAAFHAPFSSKGLAVFRSALSAIDAMHTIGANASFFKKKGLFPFLRDKRARISYLKARMKRFFSICHRLLEGNRSLFVISIVAQLFMGLASVYSTFLLKVVVDSFQGIEALKAASPLENAVIWIITFGQGNTYLLSNQALVLSTALLVAGVLSAGFTSLRMGLRSYLTAALAGSMQTTVFIHLERLPYPYYKEHKSGDLIQTCTRDLDVLRRFLIGDVSSFFWTLWMVSFCMGTLIAINWKMGLVSMGLFPLMFLYSFFLIKKVRERYRAADDSEAAMTDKIQENLDGIRLVKAFHNEAYEIGRFELRLKDYEKRFVSWRKLSSFFFSSSDIFIFGSKVLALIYGIYLCFTGEINSATLILAILFVNMSVWPLRETAISLSNLGQYMASSDRIATILDAPMEDLESGLIPSFQDDIRFEHVSFHYPDDPEQEILKDVSFTIKHGESLAIMGKTGSGKSTLSALLTRLYDYTGGEIYIGKTPLKNVQKKALRKEVKSILQEPFLFSKTIEENLLLGNEAATHEEIEEATHLADIDRTIHGYKEGYNTMIGERGTTLSGGQRQRLAIARGALSKSAYLIFDDSLSAVDAETDQRIRENLRSLKGQVTAILVTHRVSTASDCDHIIVLEDGRVAQDGTHESLSKEEGLYKRLEMIQSKMGGHDHA